MTSKMLLVAAVLVALCGAAFSQTAISTKSGLINDVEGQVVLNDKPVVAKAGVLLPAIEEKSALKTGDGRAEVLLTPGVFLRQGENSEIRMLTNRLIDVRLEVVSGEVIVEVAELLKDNNVTLIVKSSEIALRKPGVYRVDVQDPARLQVYAGEAAVTMAGQTVGVTKGKQLLLSGVLVAQKFNTKETTALFRWSARRDEYMAVANLSAAKTIRDRGIGWNTAGWYFNPYFGMYTYVPYRGTCRSFFGDYGFWSPGQVYNAYYRRAEPTYSSGGAGNWNTGMGYGSGMQTSSGNSGAMAATSSAPTTSSSAASAPVSRESSSGGGRGR